MTTKDKWAIDLIDSNHIWKEIDRFYDEYPDMRIVIYECERCFTFKLINS